MCMCWTKKSMMSFAADDLRMWSRLPGPHWWARKYLKLLRHDLYWVQWGSAARYTRCRSRSRAFAFAFDPDPAPPALPWAADCLLAACNTNANTHTYDHDHARCPPRPPRRLQPADPLTCRPSVPTALALAPPPCRAKATKGCVSLHLLPAHDRLLTAPKVAADDEADSPAVAQQQWPPASPPPSFRSRASSPTSRRLLSDDPLAPQEDRTLADTFDSDSDEDEDEHGRDDRQRLMRGNPTPEDDAPEPGLLRRTTELPTFSTQTPASGRVYGGGNGGVWANLSAKPTRGEDLEEKPPVRACASGSRVHCIC